MGSAKFRDGGSVFKLCVERKLWIRNVASLCGECSLRNTMTCGLQKQTWPSVIVWELKDIFFSWVTFLSEP
jgi:hypothetical protein